MDTKIKSAFVIIIPIIVILSGCFKNLICNYDITYSFQFTAQAYPDNDSISIGDTVWLEINIPVILKDDISGGMINFSNAQNLSIDVGVFGLISIDSIMGSAKNFNFVSIKGKQINSTNPNSFISFSMVQENSVYRYLVGFVPLKSGVYRIGIGNPNNVYCKPEICKKAAFTVNFTNTKQHFYFNKIVNPNYDPPSNSGGGSYFFKVK